MGQRPFNYFPFLFFSVLCFLSSVFCFSVFADKIYLKDGKVYDGKLVAKSDRRFVFVVDAAGEPIQTSFFTEEVEKIELSKDTVEEQIPYLKEVESFKVAVDTQQPRVYELSLYQKNDGLPNQVVLMETELRRILDKNEYEYYQKFNDILKKYADKLNFTQNLYLSLTTASREDFASAKQYMDELYFELNNIFIPEVFKKSHMAFLEATKATFLAFNALGEGKLDEASKQIKISEEAKQRAMYEFREAINRKKTAAGASDENTVENDETQDPQ